MDGENGTGYFLLSPIGCRCCGNAPRVDTRGLRRRHGDEAYGGGVAAAGGGGVAAPAEADGDVLAERAGRGGFDADRAGPAGGPAGDFVLGGELRPAGGAGEGNRPLWTNGPKQVA